MGWGHTVQDPEARLMTVCFLGERQEATEGCGARERLLSDLCPKQVHLAVVCEGVW